MITITLEDALDAFIRTFTLIVRQSELADEEEAGFDILGMEATQGSVRPTAMERGVQTGTGHITLVLEDMFEGSAECLVVPCSTGGNLSTEIRSHLQMMGVWLEARGGLKALQDNTCRIRRQSNIYVKIGCSDALSWPSRGGPCATPPATRALPLGQVSNGVLTHLSLARSTAEGRKRVVNRFGHRHRTHSAGR
jgi:hypothetical protein